MQDVLTRYVKLVATSDNSAETAVRVLIDEWVTQFDLPEVIGSDQGPHFTAIVFETICKELGIEHARRISSEQNKRGQRTKTLMKRPYEIGERVRMRLTETARNKRGGGGMTMERHDNTYKVRPEDNPNGRIKQRHYDELEPAPRQTLTWETDSTEGQADSSDTDREVEYPQLRCSQRRNQPPKRLQVDGHRNRYEQHEVTVTEIEEWSDED